MGTSRCGGASAGQADWRNGLGAMIGAGALARGAGLSWNVGGCSHNVRHRLRQRSHTGCEPQTVDVRGAQHGSGSLAGSGVHCGVHAAAQGSAPADRQSAPPQSERSGCSATIRMSHAVRATTGSSRGGIGARRIRADLGPGGPTGHPRAERLPHPRPSDPPPGRAGTLRTGRHPPEADRGCRPR